MRVCDQDISGARQRIAFVGSCRVSGAAIILHDRGDLQYVWNDNALPTTTADVMQNLRLVEKRRELPPIVQRLIYNPVDQLPLPDDLVGLTSIDTFVVELSDINVIVAEPWSIQVDRLVELLLEPHADVMLPWWREICVRGWCSDEVAETTLAALKPRDLLGWEHVELVIRKTTRTLQSEATMHQAMEAMITAFPGRRWIFVSHFVVDGVTGDVMSQRRQMRDWLKSGAAKFGAEFWDPSVLVAEAGRETALAADGVDIYHYAPNFEPTVAEALLAVLNRAAGVRAADPARVLKLKLPAYEG